MNHKLLSKVLAEPDIKYIFCDYYDTIVHRSVHPLQPFRTWAKYLCKDFNLDTSINSLYQTRRSSINHVSAQMGIVETEIAYEVIIREIYNRLNETQVLNAKAVNFSSFLDKSLEADYNSEANVQYLNKDVIAVLRHLKDKGYIIYCVSDFYSDESFIKRLMRKHGVLDLYDKVYVSASENASKENNGLLFSQILKSNQIDPNQAFMIGDNFKSDFVNAKMHGLRAYHLKSFQNKIKQKAQFAQLTARILFSS